MGAPVWVAEYTLTELANAWSESKPSVANLHKSQNLIFDDPKWWGCNNKEEAREILLTGWPEGTERVSKLASDLAPPQAKSIRRVSVDRDDGDDLLIDRALRGDWDRAWRSSRRQSCVGPQTIDLFAKFGGSCAKNAEEIFWAGAASAAVCDLLESAGYRVRIVASMLCATRHDGGAIRMDFVVKEAGEPLNLPDLIATIAHRAVFRGLGFKLMEQCPLDIGAHGLWGEYDLAQAQEALREAGWWYPEGSIVMGQTYSREAAENEIKRVLSQLGAEQ